MYNNMATLNISYSAFCKEIADLENNPNDWKFLGARPALIDFYASWCGPCKMLAPVLEELSVEYEGKVDIYKIDVDKEERLAEYFDIRSIGILRSFNISSMVTGRNKFFTNGFKPSSIVVLIASSVVHFLMSS